jgi:hypothetical protein
MHGVAPQMCGQVASPLLGCLDMSVQRQFQSSVCSGLVGSGALLMDPRSKADEQ